MSDFSETALSLARYGWPVFPCKAGMKAPATDHGWKEATTDLDKIREWWTEDENYNIAIATGITSCGTGPYVVDFDIDKPDEKPALMPVSEGYEILRVAGLLRGAGPIIRTPSGGFHLYFLASEQPNGAYLGGYPIDTRGAGGYVLTAPSTVNGKRYEVLANRPAASTFNLEAARELLTPPPPPPKAVTAPGYEDHDGYSGGGTDALVRFVQNADQGERRPKLWWALCKAAESGEDLESIIQAAVEAHGFDERDIRRQARNAERRAGK